MVILVPDPSQGERDRYGRVLAYVERPGGTDVGAALLREGYAREDTDAAASARQASDRASQREAQQAGRGLWGACAAGAAMLVPPAAPGAPGSGDRGPYDPAGSDRDCSDFATQAEAQAFFEAAQRLTGQRDRHRLDSDGDGRVCESLP